MAEETNAKPEETKNPEKANTEKRESIEVERDKKGRFIKQNKNNKSCKEDDGTTVKIKVGTGKTSAPQKDAKEEGNTKPDGNGNKDKNESAYANVTFVGMPVGFFRSVCYPWWHSGGNWFDSLWKRQDAMFDRMDRMFDSFFEKMPKATDFSLNAFIRKVSDTKPDTLTINGRKYYSEENVAHKVADTITTCAQVAIDEMAKNAAAAGGNANKPTLQEQENKTQNAQSGKKAVPAEDCPPSKKSDGLPNKRMEKCAKVIANLIMILVCAFACIGMVFVVKKLFF